MIARDCGWCPTSGMQLYPGVRNDRVAGASNHSPDARLQKMKRQLRGRVQVGYDCLAGGWARQVWVLVGALPPAEGLLEKGAQFTLWGERLSSLVSSFPAPSD